MDKKIFIVFFSANGATRKVAEIIQEGVAKSGSPVSMLSLGGQSDAARIVDELKAAGSDACLFIGSPVYRDGAVPGVMTFLENLPMVEGAVAVPFVTWGQACSGLALWQMANALMAKGFSLAGAAKVLAVHSMMWRVKNPPGGGHPDQEDRRRLLEMVDRLLEGFESGNPPLIGIERLDYQPDEQSEQIKEKIAGPWKIVPKSVKQDACTQCGICEQECPVDAIALDPYPEFDNTCCDCFNCIRLCPEDAFELPVSMDKIEGYIWDRVNNIDEQPYTKVFL